MSRQVDVGVPMHFPRRMGETFRRFQQCMMWAKKGKTFIYYHPDFVAIDQKTWAKLQKREQIPKTVYYDEYQDWTPEMEARLNKYLAGRLRK